MSSYIHGTDADEQRRLSQLNEHLNEQSVSEIRLRGGEKVLDVGSGLGQLSRAFARAAGPRGKVVGIERSPEQIAEAQRQATAAGEQGRVEFRQGEATALPLSADEWGTFDVAHARFLLEHVKRPDEVVRQMVKAVRPGGRVVLEDDDHDTLRLWPEPPSFPTLWAAYARAYDRLGNDPFVGRRLVQLLHGAGARPSRNTGVFFGGHAGSPELQEWSKNLAMIINQSKATVLEGGLLDSGTFDAAIEAIGTWSQRPDAAAWYSLAWAEGVKV